MGVGDVVKVLTLFHSMFFKDRVHVMTCMTLELPVMLFELIGVT